MSEDPTEGIGDVLRLADSDSKRAVADTEHYLLSLLVKELEHMGHGARDRVRHRFSGWVEGKLSESSEQAYSNALEATASEYITELETAPEDF